MLNPTHNMKIILWIVKPSAARDLICLRFTSLNPLKLVYVGYVFATPVTNKPMAPILIVNCNIGKITTGVTGVWIWCYIIRSELNSKLISEYI